MAMKKIDNKDKLLKILVVILIVIIIMAIWFIKTNNTPTPIDEQTQEVSDFVLEASSIDLDMLKEYNMPIIVDFGSDSCIPCKEMEPVLIKMNEEMQGKAIIKFVDVWKNKNASSGFPVQVIPTQIFITADGKPYVPSEDINISFNMYNAKDTEEHVFTTHQGGLTEDQMRAILADMEVLE